MYLESQDFPGENIWEKFETGTKSSFSEIRIETGAQKQEIYYGIQKYRAENISMVFRIESDVLLVSQDWSYGKILPLENPRNLQAFLIQLFYTHALKRQMIEIHSALIKSKEKGILFLGPSGIGKTTQAELWRDCRGAEIINGDIVFVQETEQGFLGWGTPWHGSSPYCINTNVPVTALIVLKQAKENTIRELTGFEKVSAVSNNIFYPRWLENGMELCLDVLNHLLSTVPVYELSCRPDEEAVAITEKAVFGD